jgi:threonine/homoserine/homoserine lactone efflux protein
LGNATGQLVQVGIKAIRNRRHASFTDRQPVASSPRRLVGEGLVVGITNPKSVVFSVAVLKQLWTTRPGP